MNDDPILEPKHKIFLSHNRAQKEFVEHLCEALERRHRFPFFDKRPSSLPKGERFPELILKAAEQCHVAVVVISEDYFMSKWPMIELHTFAQAVYKSNTELKILPLFYGLSVSEFRDATRQKKWFNQWEIWAKNDAQGRIKVNEWKDALDIVGSFNGISYNRELQEIVAYQDEIVSHICSSTSPDFKWHDSHVQGKSNICKVIIEKIQQIGPPYKYEVNVIGIYGVGGIGKTTICKTLCNELSVEFKGRVSHVEFKSRNSNLVELLRKTVTDLTNTSVKDLQTVTEGQYKDILHRNLVKQRTFLALDNVWDDHQSIKQAKIFLESPFHERSLVIVTARSRSTIELLGIKGDECFEMPELGEQDAMNLFLYHVARGKQFDKEEEKRDILECIRSCYYKKGDKGGYHYHPLALEALGLQLGCLGEKPSEWVKNLWRVKNFRYLTGENPVFAILRSSFDLLPPTDQNLFMDVIFYTPNMYRRWNAINLMGWLCLVYKADEHDIKSRLDLLKGKGLLQDVDLTSGEVSMHDLYREFAELEVTGMLAESTDLEKRRWIYVRDGDLSELEISPGGGGCWQKLVRLGIQQLPWSDDLRPSNAIESLEGIQWQYCSNIVVLKLHGLRLVRGALNMEGLKSLRSVQFHDVVGLDRLEGLEGLRNLIYFIWRDYLVYSTDIDVDTLIVGKFPASLKVLRIWGHVLLRPDVLACCNSLCTLYLSGVQAENLDLSNCSSLQSVMLRYMRKLRSLSFVTARGATRLQSLEVWYCGKLVDIPGLDHLIGLERLVLEDCEYMELPDLQSLIKLQVLRFVNRQVNWTAEDVRTQFVGQFPASLKILRIKVNAIWLRPDVLARCNNLFIMEVGDVQANNLDLSNCSSLPTVTLSNIQKLRTLSFYTARGASSLQSLVLTGCRDLVDIPGLDRLISLERLELQDCETMELPNLQSLTKLQVLIFMNQQVNWTAEDVHTQFVGQFPASLKILRIKTAVWLGPVVFAPCNNLCTLELQDILADSLDLSNCSSLQSVSLENVRKLRTLSFVTARGASRLKSLMVKSCVRLVDILGLDRLICLGRLVLERCGFMEMPDLQNLTKLQFLSIVGKFSNEKTRLRGDGLELCIPRQLRQRLCCLNLISAAEAPSLWIRANARS